MPSWGTIRQRKQCQEWSDQMTKGPDTQRFTEPRGPPRPCSLPKPEHGLQGQRVPPGKPYWLHWPLLRVDSTQAQANSNPRKPLPTNPVYLHVLGKEWLFQTCASTECLPTVPIYSRTHKTTHGHLAQEIKGCCSPLQRDRSEVL